jgi:inorganic pyrophosphatase
LYADIHDITDVPKHYLKEVAHFFSVYKDLEGARVEVVGWEDAQAAKKQIEHAVRLYQSTFQPPSL